MALKKHAVVDSPSPHTTATKGKRIRKSAQAVSSDAPEAPGWQLPLEELSDFIPDQFRGYAEGAKLLFHDSRETEEKLSGKDNGLQQDAVVFRCLYYRCKRYSEEMKQALIDELIPQVFRLTSHDTKGIGQRFQTLQTEIATRHMQLATLFVKQTERGQVYTQEATRLRGSGSGIPQLGPEEILEALQLTSGALRLL